MKIFQMIDIPWDSGLAHYALLLSAGLKRKGHQVFISAVPGQKPWLKAKKLGLKTVPLATWKGLQPLRRFLKDHSIDLINAHTGATHSLAVAAVLGQDVAVVRTRSDARHVKSKVGSQFLYKRTHRVIAAADYIRRAFLDELKLASSKVVTVYQGLAVTDIDATPLPHEPILGIVARLDPVKGHRYLLEALSLLRDRYPTLRLQVVGQEENVKMRELRSMAKHLRIDEQVDFVGHSSKVSSDMAQCRVGVIASTGSEAVSRVALEWMASGRPIVSTDVGCLPEMVDEGKTGLLVAAKNAPALARAIAQLLNQPRQAEAMGREARRQAEERFTMDRFVEQTIDVYRAALKERDHQLCRN